MIRKKKDKNRGCVPGFSKVGLIGIIVLVFIIGFLAVIANKRDTVDQDIVVKKDFEKKLKVYHQVCIYAQNDKFKDPWQRRTDPWAFFVESEICRTMMSYGLEYYGDDEKCDLKVEAIVKAGWGIPRTGRHLNIHFKDIVFVNIKLIDKNTLETIGEVEYNKSFLSDKSPYFVRNMLDKLLTEKGTVDLIR